MLFNQSVASTRFIDATLELGGKDPAYVAEDANLNAAIDTLVDGALYNSGQSCCAIGTVVDSTELINLQLVVLTV